MKSIHFKFSVIPLAALFFISSGCDKDEASLNPSPTNTFVDVGGHKLYLSEFGNSDSDTIIVFEAGFGGNTDWNAVIRQVYKHAKCYTYKRAGYLPSEAGPKPRNLKRIEGELTKLISTIGSGKNLVLVGHSYGGIIIRSYAAKNPDKIAGLVFVDPSHEDFNVNPLTQEQIDSIADRSPGIIMDESRWIQDSYDLMKELPPIPDVPVVAITSMRQDNNTDFEMQKKWYNAHEQLGIGIKLFKHISATNSGHFIQFDEPKLVIEAIEDIFYSRIK